MSEHINQSARTALVTGAAGGVGRQTVEQLTQQGWRVFALTHSEEDAATLAQQYQVEALAVDLTHVDDLQQWVQTHIVDAYQLKQLDLLAHVAAIAAVGPAALADAAVWQRVLHTNLIAPAILTGALLPQLRAAQGTIVFVNSGAGERAVRDHAVYAASKHGLRGYANTLRLEESEHGVRVSTIYPGQIATPMLAKIDRDLGTEFEPERYIQPQTVARAIVAIAQASPDVQITNVDVRPRQEVSARFNV